MLVRLVNTCQPVPQADKPKKWPEVHKFFVSLKNCVHSAHKLVFTHNCRCGVLCHESCVFSGHRCGVKKPNPRVTWLHMMNPRCYGYNEISYCYGHAMSLYEVLYSGSKNCFNVWLFWKDELTTNQENSVK